MLFILQHILNRPLHLFLKRLLANHTIIFGANGTAEIKAGIGMYKQFEYGTKFLFYQAAQLFHFLMRFNYIKVPGHSKMTIYMILTTVFYHPQVVQVYPVGAAVGVQYGQHIL